MKHDRITKVLFSIATLSLTFGLASCVHAQTNIALGKKITTNKPSNYALTKDKNPAQLTDGKYAGSEYDAQNKTSSLWVQHGSVVWSERKNPIIFTIDLGKIMPISGVSFSTAAGAGSVQFPSFAGIAVSDDGKVWHYQGNLINLSRKTAVPDLNKYSKFRFTTHDLKTKGRYVALAVVQIPYTVTDEIEVYSGDDAWLALPAGGKLLASPAAMKSEAAASVAATFAQRRVATDIKNIREILDHSSLSITQKSTFSAHLDKAAEANEQSASVDGDIKTILPINGIHKSVMAVYGEILAAQNFAPLTVWKQHRYAWLPFIATPENGQNPAINISMLGNQFRSDAVLITNASDSSRTVQLKIQNPPANAKAGWLKIDQAIWTDTYQGTPIADALLPVEQNQLTIPAGFTAKIWLTVDSSKVPAGSYKSTFVINGNAFPFHLDVSKTAMQRPRLSLSMWDYTDPVSMKVHQSRGITPQNKDAAIAMMKSHYVNSPWASRGILPFPKAADFDAQNNLDKPLDFAAFDQWIAEWPGARHYFVFISAKEKEAFAGAERGTAEFNARLGSWAKVLSAHMKKRNLDPGKLAFCIVDEPHLEWQDDVTADWGKAIDAAAPELTLVSDPTWKRPDEKKNQEAITQMDILISNTQIYDNSPQEVRDYFQKQHTDGKELWLYVCIGPVRLFNPQQYYRDQAWRVFSMDGDGMGFWSFGDLGGAPSTWNDYQIARSYSPAFIDKDTVYNSIHWDAVREGVEDFEELTMLHDAIQKYKGTPLQSRAQAVLDEAVKTVTATATNGNWQKETNPELVDKQLQKVQVMLEEVNNIF
jgi:hypothetical protein